MKIPLKESFPAAHASQGVTEQTLTRDQIQRICRLSQDDKLLHPLIVSAICTGQRLGDICNLKWAAVDLESGLIDVSTTQPGRVVAIPILPQLRKVLEAQKDIASKGRSMVFPEAARRYNFKNTRGTHSLRGHLLNGVKALIGRALGSSSSDNPVPTAPPNRPSAEEVASRVSTAGFALRKAERMILTYRHFADGKSYSQIAALTGRSKGQCSADLKTIERLIGASLRPGSSPQKTNQHEKPLADLVQMTRRMKGPSQHGPHQRQTSVYGWRSFRPAFCALALDADIPFAVIERIVGRRIAASAFDQALASGEISAIPQSIASRALALARDVISPRQTAIVNAVLNAAGVDTNTDPKHALALLRAAVITKTRSGITAALKAAGIQRHDRG